MKIIDDDQAGIDPDYLDRMKRDYDLERFVIHLPARLKPPKPGSKHKVRSLLPKDTATRSKQLYPALVSDAIGCGMFVMGTNIAAEDALVPKFIDAFKDLSSTGIASKTNLNRFVNNPITLKLFGTNHPLPRFPIYRSPYAIHPDQWLDMLMAGVPEYVAHFEDEEMVRACCGAFEQEGTAMVVPNEEDWLAVLANMKDNWKHGLILRNSDLANDAYFRGNHFLELQYLEEIYDPEMAERYGLETGRLMVTMHSHGHDFSSVMKSSLLARYYNDPLQVIKEDSELYRMFFIFKEVLKGQSSLQRATIMIKLLHLARKYLETSDIRFMPIAEATHNDIYREGDGINYIRDAHRLYPDRLSIVSGNRDNATYVVLGGPNADHTLGTIFHGLGHALEQHPEAAGTRKSHVITKENRFLPPFRLSPRFNMETVPVRTATYSDEVMAAMEQRGILKRILKLQPMLTLKHGVPYSRFEYMVYRMLSRKDSSAHY